MNEQLRVLVCGGRDYAGYLRFVEVMNDLDHTRGIDTVIHGGARGADRMAGKWAEARGKACRVVFADWNRHGRAAGCMRNQQMLDEQHPELVVAFPGGRGTADMVRRAKGAGVEVIEVDDLV